MNDQNETTQLRYLEETATRLRQNGFTVEPIEDHHLPVCWEKGRLCRVSGKGSVLYRQERVDALGAQDALQAVIDTAKMTSEYMAILEYAPQLKATDLTGDYRILADFGDAVLAGHPTERGVQFVTWEWDFDRKGVHQGHYFQDNYEAAKRDFTVRSGLVQKGALFHFPTSKRASLPNPSPGRSISGCSGLFFCLQGGLHNERSERNHAAPLP